LFPLRRTSHVVSGYRGHGVHGLTPGQGPRGEGLRRGHLQPLGEHRQAEGRRAPHQGGEGVRRGAPRAPARHQGALGEEDSLPRGGVPSLDPDERHEDHDTGVPERPRGIEDYGRGEAGLGQLLRSGGPPGALLQEGGRGLAREAREPARRQLLRERASGRLLRRELRARRPGYEAGIAVRPREGSLRLHGRAGGPVRGGSLREAGQGHGRGQRLDPPVREGGGQRDGLRARGRGPRQEGLQHLRRGTEPPPARRDGDGAGPGREDRGGAGRGRGSRCQGTGRRWQDTRGAGLQAQVHCEGRGHRLPEGAGRPDAG